MTKEHEKLGGLLELSEDDKDFQLGAIIKWPKLSELPSEFLVSPFSIKNQIADDNNDYCGSCAGTGMTEPKEEVEMFYPFLFAASKHEEGGNPDSFGLMLRDVGKGLTKWGIPEVKDVPDEIKNLSQKERRRLEFYPESVKKAALKHRAQSYFFLKGGPYDHYDNARAVEWYFRDKKQHVLLGVFFGWLLSDFYLDGTPNGVGHAMWQAGWYSDGIRVVNSAGKEAGRDGLHCLSRSTFNKYAEKFGLMIVVDMSRDEAEYCCKNKVRMDQNWFVQLIKSFINLFK